MSDRKENLESSWNDRKPAPLTPAILRWLGGPDTGLSSKAIALAALGAPPERLDYPHDADDFGRCFRLLAACPEAKAGRDWLANNGGPVWAALIARWDDIEAAYLHDLQLPSRAKTGWRCSPLMRSIIDAAHISPERHLQTQKRPRPGRSRDGRA